MKMFSWTSYLPLHISCGFVRLLSNSSGLIMDEAVACVVETLHKESELVFAL